MMKRATTLLVILLVLAGLAGWWYFTTSPQQAAQLMTRLGLSLDQAAQLVAQLAPAEARAAEAALSASGTIEGEEISITAEVGGRIEALLADEGDEVGAGAVLVRLDEALLEAQVNQAQAALETAKAKLAQVQAGARPEEIAAAQAALAEAQAAQEGTYWDWQNALEARDDPQQLETQISQARTEVELANVQLDQARTALAEAEVMRDHYQLFQAGDDNKTKYLASLKQVEAAQADVQAAEAALKGAQVQLEHLLTMNEKPLVLNAQVNAAWAGYQAAQAALEMAQAGLEALEAGPTEEEVAVAQAEVAKTEAALGVLEVQLEKLTLRSPTGGLVTGRMVQVGEMAVPGANLLTVADLDKVTLTVYIPEDEIGRAKVGQAVEVSVDSFPGKVFEGRVSYIASEAEFTPKNVQTQKERVNMVFAVKVKVPNPAHELKPGVPADAVIRE
ncbi:MAG: HlyD family secretion protein [Anaerolineae bacterium]